MDRSLAVVDAPDDPKAIETSDMAEVAIVEDVSVAAEDDVADDTDIPVADVPDDGALFSALVDVGAAAAGGVVAPDGMLEGELEHSAEDASVEVDKHDVHAPADLPPVPDNDAKEHWRILSLRAKEAGQVVRTLRRATVEVVASAVEAEGCPVENAEAARRTDDVHLSHSRPDGTSAELKERTVLDIRVGDRSAKDSERDSLRHWVARYAVEVACATHCDDQAPSDHRTELELTSNH